MSMATPPQGEVFWGALCTLYHTLLYGQHFGQLYCPECPHKLAQRTSMEACWHAVA